MYKLLSLWFYEPKIQRLANYYGNNREKRLFSFLYFDFSGVASLLFHDETKRFRLYVYGTLHTTPCSFLIFHNQTNNFDIILLAL